MRKTKYEDKILKLKSTFKVKKQNNWNYSILLLRERGESKFMSEFHVPYTIILHH